MVSRVIRWTILCGLIGGLFFAVSTYAQVRQDRAVDIEALNSPYNDFGPVITPDGNTMYFTSDRPGGAGGQDIWMSKRVGGEWTKPVNVKELNTPQNEGPDSITPDGKTMYTTGCNRRKDGSDKCDIYVSHLGSDGKWSTPENLGPPINTNNEETNASISYDGKTLFLSSDRPGGQGGYDIWTSTLGANGKWTEPVNLGPTVNTASWEGVAFIVAEGSTLYFSSTGHGGFGNADVFMTQRQANGKWSEPVNMGGLINTAYNDIYFVFPASGDLAYFSSSNEGGLGQEDIYAIPKRLVLESKDFVVVRGRVYDAGNTQKSLAAMLTISGGSQNKMSNTSNPRTGNYNLSLKIGGVYSITASAKGYIDRTETIDLKDADPFHIVVKDIPLSPVVVATETTELAGQDEIDNVLIEGGKLVVRNVLFDFNRSDLKEGEIKVLNNLVTFMKNNPTVSIKIDGHCDSIGADEYNMKLSMRRAKSVKGYMVKHGVRASRIVTEGHGKRNLLVQDEVGARVGNPKNRRVEFSLIKGVYKPSTNPNTSMRGKQPPEEIVLAQVASLEPGYFDIPDKITLKTATISTEIINRVPVQIGRQFSANVGRLYFYTRILGADDPAKITHIWYYQGRVVKKVTLDVKSPDYRTSSYLNIKPEWRGVVRVECVGPDGELLRTLRVTLTE